MDPNLVYWKSEGKSFFSRLGLWFNVLDPTSLLSSDTFRLTEKVKSLRIPYVPLPPQAEIRNAHSSLGTGGKQNEKAEHAWILSLSSVHADSGAVLPLVFRAPALFPVSGPLVIASFLPHSKVIPALFWQFLLQSYSAGFNYANRNSSAEQGKKTSMKQAVLVVGSVAYATVAGAIPQIVIQRLGITSPPFLTFFRSILPIPLSAALAAFNVLTVRSEETENGIQVFDSNGNAVGISRAAGEKAVRDTALARATLLGTTAAVPNLLVFLFQKTRAFQNNPLLVAPVRHISAAFVLGLMIPVSFSLFPQLGKIKKEKLERDLQAAAVDGLLFYHRGL